MTTSPALFVAGLAVLSVGCGSTTGEDRADSPDGDPAATAPPPEWQPDPELQLPPEADEVFEAGRMAEFIAYGRNGFDRRDIETGVAAADTIRSLGGTPIGRSGEACLGEQIRLDVASGEVLRHDFAEACAEADPYIAIFVDPGVEAFDPVEDPARAAPRLPFLLDLSDELSPLYDFATPVDARPVAGVVSLGSRDADDEIAELELAVMDAGGAPTVEEFDACDPVAAWVTDTDDGPIFDWAQGWTDCDQFSPHAAVYSEMPDR